MVNNTIVANSGSGIFFGNAFPTNFNNLIAFNSAGLERSDSSAITFKNSDVYGNSVLAQNTDFVGIPSAIGVNNNISADQVVPRTWPARTSHFSRVHGSNWCQATTTSSLPAQPGKACSSSRASA